MVYFVIRCQYESPIGHRLVKLGGESLLHWLQRIWLTEDRQNELLNLAGAKSFEHFNPYDIYDEFHEIAINEIFSVNFYNVTEFIAKMMGHKVPKSFEDLGPFIKSFTSSLMVNSSLQFYGEGNIWFDEHAIEADSNDDEIEYTWHLFDSTYANENQDKVAFLLHEDWRLPEDYSSDGWNLQTPTGSLLTLEDEDGKGASTYCCFFSAMDGETISDSDGTYRIPCRLNECVDWLRLQNVSPAYLSKKEQEPWHPVLLLLRACAMTPSVNTFAELLKVYDLTDDMFQGWLPLDFKYPDSAAEDEDFLARDNYQETRTDLTWLIKTSKPSTLKKDSLIQVSDHMAQIIFIDSENLGPTGRRSQRWIFFDDFWAAANRDLAESILHCGRSSLRLF